jgi:tetratricopeptide (TPR) repeat protein
MSHAPETKERSFAVKATSAHGPDLTTQSTFDRRSRLPGVCVKPAKFGRRALVRRVVAMGIVSFAILVINAAGPANAANADNAASGAHTRIIDVVADNALRTRKAIRQGDYASALKITTEVLARSKIENWRFYPFSEFIGEITYVVDPDLGKRLDEWVAQDKDNAIPLLLRAQYYYDKGWATRGRGFSTDTQADRLVAFADYMAKALADIEATIRLDQHNPYAFHLKLRILLGYGNVRAMKAAFEAAQARFPEYYALYDVYLNALQPKWGGSVAAMYAFVDKYARGAPEFSPLKLLYLDLYERLLDAALVRCGQYQLDRDWTTRCAADVMRDAVKPELETQVSTALQLYDHTDKYQFGLAIRELLFTMLGLGGGEAFAGDILEQAVSSMHSDTQLKKHGSEHNDYIIDEVVAASWNTKGFYDNALTKYQEALVDAQAAEFPSDNEKDMAIAYIYEQLAEVSGDGLRNYNDMITYEKSALEHGVAWNEHRICYAYYKLRRYQDAIAACADAIRDTENASARYWRGMAYRDAGNMDAALNDFAGVADSEGYFSASAAIMMSTILFDRNDNQGALDILNKYAFLYDPYRTSRSDVAVAYNNRCYAYMQLGELEKALSDCTSSLRFGSLPDAYRKQQELVKRLGQ